jgi:hypothetical protein
VTLSRYIVYLTSDHVLFGMIQFALVGWATVSYLTERRGRRQRSGSLSATVVLKRGTQSMGLLYATYAAITESYVAIDLGADPAVHHRTLFVELDSVLVWYICVINTWFAIRSF